MHTGTGFANGQMHTGTGSALVILNTASQSWLTKCINFEEIYHCIINETEATQI